MEVLQSFGFDIKLLITSTINFILLLWILNKVLYQPLLVMLDKRRLLAAETVKNAEETTTKLNDTIAKEKDVLHQARIQADKLIRDVEAHAKKRELEVMHRAEDQARELITQTKSSLIQMEAKMKQDLEAHTAELVLVATQTILQEHTPPQIDKKLIDQVLMRL